MSRPKDSRSSTYPRIQVIFTQLIDRVLPHSPGATQTLILAHRQELVEQAARHCSNAYPTKSVEIEMGHAYASGYADITIASMRSIISGDRIEKFDPNKFKLVLVDEAHHIVAPGYLKVLDYFGLKTANSSSPALVGVSATMSRLDGLKLGVALDQIVYHKDYIDMIGEKWLSDVSFTTVRSTADISSVARGHNGDFMPGQLSEAVNQKHVNDLTVRSWFSKAKGRKSTLVFCVDIAHVKGLTNTFRANGIDAKFVTGTTPKAERSSLLDSFKRGDYPVLVNCGVFTEGTDIPNIDCILLGRPTKSRNLLVQMIGRGMRLHPGKLDCHVIDMVASLENGVVTTPTLFGLDPSELLEESSLEDIDELKAKKAQALEELRLNQERRKEEELETKNRHATHLAEISREKELWQKQDQGERAQSLKVTFTHYDSVFDLLDDNTGEHHIRRISPNAWVCVSWDRFILSNATGTYLKIQKSEDNGSFIITETVQIERSDSKGRKSPFMKPREIAKSHTFRDAVHAADTYANKRYSYNFIARNLPWRNKPATEGQLMFLNKIRPKGDQLTPESVTKGKAGDMITKMKHGARGQFSSLESERRKKEKAQSKIEQELLLKARENVSVGAVMH